MSKQERERNKKEFLNLKILTKKREKKNKIVVDFSWIIKITVIAFLMSIFFSAISEMILPNVNVVIGVFIVILFIGIGVLFDMIGVAVTSAEEKPFHSMNSRKVKGAKTAVKFIKNADKVSSFCNDVVGDICGIISGSAGAIISTSVSAGYHTDIFITTLLVTAMIAALTIGGKAFGKSIAINKNNIILFEFAKFVEAFIRG